MWKELLSGQRSQREFEHATTSGRTDLHGSRHILGVHGQCMRHRSTWSGQSQKVTESEIFASTYSTLRASNTFLESLIAVYI